MGSGGYAPRAIPWEGDHDICTEESYPYTARDGSCHESGCSVGIPRGGVTGVKWVDKNVQAMMQAVSGVPLSIAMDASPWQCVHWLQFQQPQSWNSPCWLRQRWPRILENQEFMGYKLGRRRIYTRDPRWQPMRNSGSGRLCRCDRFAWAIASITGPRTSASITGPGTSASFAIARQVLRVE